MYMKRRYSELVVAIRDAVRLKAQEIPKFKESGNGAIRILAYPCSAKADYWLGGVGDFNSHDIPDYEHTFAISPGGSRVINGIWDGVKQAVDCYAYSALKIAHCSRVQDKGLGLLSGVNMNDPNLVEENGFSSHRGALCVEVEQSSFYRSVCGAILPTEPKNFCSLYVCVSGADSNDDLRCAFAAVDVIKKFFDDENKGFLCHAPSLPKDMLSEELG